MLMPQSMLGSTALTVTEWFGASSPPEHEGVYERLFPGGPFSCWNGRAWNKDAHGPADAALQTTLSPHQNVPWRGLLQPSPAPCATCRGHTVVDRGFDQETGADLIAECPDC
jgi:hypothetical protein